MYAIAYCRFYKMLELEIKMHILIIYLSPILKRGFRGALEPSLVFSASPNFSVTTHSFTLPASNRPMNVAFVRWSDMTFSKRIQKMIRWNDLQRIINQNCKYQCKVFPYSLTWGEMLVLVLKLETKWKFSMHTSKNRKARRPPWSSNCI